MLTAFRLRCFRCLLSSLILLSVSGCSIQRIAINRMADAMAKSGGAFASDNDPELIEAAAPFSLKLMESLLAETPAHEGLLTATAGGFTQYAFAFVQQEADEIEADDFAAAQAMRARARRLYLRARDYGLRGLDERHPGFAAELDSDPARAAARATKDTVPLLYWTAAAWSGAVGLSKDNPALIADLPKIDALIDRAVALDESWDSGALHTFLITYEMTRGGDSAERSRRHFERAVELSDGRLAAPYVSYAEAVPLQRQQPAEFRRLLEQALAIDADAGPPARLANLIAQRRARWLLDSMDELFLNP